MPETQTRMDLEDCQQWLDENVVFQPFGTRDQFSFVIDADPDTGFLRIILTNPYARNSRDHDFEAEFDDWTVLDGHNQIFMRSTTHELLTEEQLQEEVLFLVAYSMAHEGLEWVRIKGEMPHDPHVDGDVVVRIP